MAIKRILLLFTNSSFIFLILSISRCTSSKFYYDHNKLEQEFGYDFQAHPSYLSTIPENPLQGFNDIEMVASSRVTLINVSSFGAKGDGVTDDTTAFEKGWKEACSSNTSVHFVVHQNKNYLLKPITFSGPCKSSISMQIFGSLEASNKMSDYNKDRDHWILFNNVQNLEVEGGGRGVINGNGKIWWKNSCKIDKSLPCKNAPTALTFYNCKNLKAKNLKIKNAQQIHVSFERSTNVEASNLMVTASKNSPNTDGIHVANTQNIHISNTTIGTGDDCISIASGSQKVKATHITCGPGHGISIGSLGSGNSEAHVSNVTISGAKLSGTTNGLRIKTWQGGFGSARNIIFQNVEIKGVENPIIIDQNYCDQADPCKEQNSAVEVKNVVYENIKGTSATNVAINLKCSKNFPCQGIALRKINLVREGRSAKAVCNNVKFSNIESATPNCLGGN